MSFEMIVTLNPFSARKAATVRPMTPALGHVRNVIRIRALDTGTQDHSPDDRDMVLVSRSHGSLMRRVIAALFSICGSTSSKR
jgi:hypothetical protein